MNQEPSVRSLLSNSLFLTLATADLKGQPWNSPLAFSYDDDLNLYWRSDQSSQHSKNILQNPKVFIVVHDPSGTGKGLYLQAVASLVEDESEIVHALSLDRHPKFKDEPAAFLGANPRRYYKAVPITAWTNADREKKGKFVDGRQELPLKNSVSKPYEYFESRVVFENLPHLGLPASITLAGTHYVANPNYHCTVVATKKISTLIAQRDHISADAAEELVMHKVNLALEKAKPHLAGYLSDLRIATVPAEGKQSIVIMAQAAGFETFFSTLARQLKLDIPVQPAHVTLYTVDGRPIGLNSLQELAERTRPLTKTELAEWGSQVDAQILGVAL